MTLKSSMNSNKAQLKGIANRSPQSNKSDPRPENMSQMVQQDDDNSVKQSMKRLSKDTQRSFESDSSTKKRQKVACESDKDLLLGSIEDQQSLNELQTKNKLDETNKLQDQENQDFPAVNVLHTWDDYVKKRNTYDELTTRLDFKDDNEIVCDLEKEELDRAGLVNRYQTEVNAYKSQIPDNLSDSVLE